ncbi:MAG: type II secretion system protein [Clostridia bacterium]|nr:type II secretion system protein [Clostridia bacterium]
MKKFWRRTKAFTLVELVVAIAVTGIIASVVSVLVGTVIRIQKNSELNAQLYNVSQRIHTAVNAQLSTAETVTLYSATTYSASVTNKEQFLYLYSANASNAKYGHLVVATYTSKNPGDELLMRGESYDGATIVDFYVTLDTITEKETSESTEAATQYRVLHVYTKLSKGGRTYEHTSTVRLYNMMLTGGKVELPSGVNYSNAVANHTHFVGVRFTVAGQNE